MSLMIFFDRAGQLTNEICFTNGLAGFVTNSWQYDEAGNWLNPDLSGSGTKWVYNADNELMARTASSDSTWTTTVSGEVQPGDGSNKWYNTTAYCRGISARVSTNDGTFSLPGVGLYPGANELQVTVTDVSGNTSQQTRTVTRNTSSCLEIFGYDGNGNLTNWVNGSQNWAYEWDWADRLTKVSSNGVVMLENWYDASSRRIARNERIGGSMVGYLSLHDGWDIVALLNTSGAIHESYTRGVSIAGDIGGLVSVTRHPFNTQYYVHNNHRGDVIHVRSGTTTTTTYRYSAFGQLLETTGANYCRFKFSSKELSASCGLYYYGYRLYAPQWQRWLNRDPIQEQPGLQTKKKLRLQAAAGWNLYQFCFNIPNQLVDSDGRSISHIVSEIGKWIGLGGHCCNNGSQTEWYLDNGVWNSLPPGSCTGATVDCDGLTCQGQFYSVSFGGNSTCGGGKCTTQPPAVPTGTFSPPRVPPPVDRGPGWTPGDGLHPSPRDRGAPDLPPGYVWPM